MFRRRRDDLPQRDSVMAIVNSERFDEVLVDISAETGRTRAELEPEAIACLNELSSELDERAIAIWDRFGRWLTRAYDVEADTRRIGELKRLNRNHSLVFLPNHRSYLDPLVLRSVLGPNGFEHNRTLGGANLRLWPISEMANRSGLIFIRRATKGDPVYPEMLRLYLGHLVQTHANLEWYFEGGRTRTGKLRPPKFGVLRYLVDAFLAAGPGIDDVYLVPVAIVYDQQAEIEALSAEEAGGKKKAESLSWVYNFAMAQGIRRGRAHVRFGEPLSLRQALSDAGDWTADQVPVDELHNVVPKVAFEVAHRINEVTPITPAALITFGLLDNDMRAMTAAETRELLEPFLEYIQRRGLPLTHDGDLTDVEGVQRALEALVRVGVVEEYRGGLEPVYQVKRDRQHEAAFYRNSVTHYFITRAVVEVAAFRSGSEDGAVARGLWQHALTLRDLLKYEFFFPSKGEFLDEILTEIDLAAPDLEVADQDSVPVLSHHEVLDLVTSSPLLLAHRVIGPFLEAYSVLADRLAAHDPASPVDTDQLVLQSLGVAQQRWLQSELHSPESISKDLMNGAIQLARNRGLLIPGGSEVAEARQEFARELTESVRAVAQIRNLVLGRLRDLDPETKADDE